LHTIETTDLKEARRFRFAQYRGERVTLSLNGFLLTGMVRSVTEDRSSTPTRWIVTIITKKRVYPNGDTNDPSIKKWRDR
jgi:hypothetical protein